MDYYIKINYEKKNEMDFSYHCKIFEYNHDFEIVSWRSDDTLLEYEVLDSNV